MHDAFNLAWKLALVEEGVAGPQLLDTYSAARSAVAEKILAESGRLTSIATVRSQLGQHLRNLVAHRLLGFASVTHALVEELSEVTIGSADSPLNAGSAAGLKGPAPGQRLITERPFGAGDVPRFALLTHDDGRAQSVLQRYAVLLEPALRAPLDERASWLVRPDGYVAAVTKAGDWPAIDACLAKIAAP